LTRIFAFHFKKPPFQSSRADRCISRVFGRPMPTRGRKKLDVQEPGLRPGAGAGAEFAGRAPRTPNTDFTKALRPPSLSTPHHSPPSHLPTPTSHQTRRTPPTPIRVLGDIENPVLARAARRAECVGVLFDLLSLVHDPSAQGSWPRTTNPMARHAPHTTCTWPCDAAAAWLASNIVVAA
jgi:hypothetical protein